MRKLIINSETAKTISKIMSNHFKALKHQPITIVINGENSIHNSIEIISVEGRMEFDLGAEIIVRKPEIVFSESDLQRLQSKVYEITGEGEVMGLFNKLLGVSAS